MLGLQHCGVYPKSSPSRASGSAPALAYAGWVLGITLFIGGSLQVFGIAPGLALLVSFVLSLGKAKTSILTISIRSFDQGSDLSALVEPLKPQSGSRS